MPVNGQPVRPRSVALVGPYGSGKSTLFAMLLAAANGTARRGDSRTHAITTEARLGHCTHLGDTWSIVDCPGSVEFAYEAMGALSVVDIAVVVCDTDPAHAHAVAPLLRSLDAAHIPHLVFINKIDTLATRVSDMLAALQAGSSSPLVLRQLPLRDGETITGFLDLVSERAYRYRRGMPSELIAPPPEALADGEEARNALLETLADYDDTLLEKILEDVRPSTEEVYEQLRRDLSEGTVTEVLLGAAEHNHGIRRLWKALRHETPDAAATATRRGIDANGGPVIQVFKTAHAGHQGKLSYARIWRGSIRDGQSLNGSRISGLFRFPEGELTKATEAGAGELVALGRLETIATGQTLGGDQLPFPSPPPPVYRLAIKTQDRKDDVKLSAALRGLTEEDPSISVRRDADTGETVLEGQGEIHLANAMERLVKAYNLRVSSHPPQTAYRETIRNAVHQHTRFKRQTGGHGQFADVKIDIAPRARGEGFLFVDKVVGGAIPRQYIPAVAEAAEEAARRGPLGYPVVDIAVTLLDGTFHSVDSSDMAFRTATRTAMADGLGKAAPVLLEPIERVTITVPNEFTAKAQRLLSGRRGQILGYAERRNTPGWDDVEGFLPAAELHDLIVELRSQTLGLGTYTRVFDHLAEAPPRAAPATI